ncbi:hypothetical protein ACFPJ1_37730 [Kribbella qitaiheensis]|uniref:hypothetical protein n=1 Tax=Kribbella qitaiheensis TaxID=1544730 RepID=UPI003619BDF4
MPVPDRPVRFFPGSDPLTGTLHQVGLIPLSGWLSDKYSLMYGPQAAFVSERFTESAR